MRSREQSPKSGRRSATIPKNHATLKQFRQSATGSSPKCRQAPKLQKTPPLPDRVFRKRHRLRSDIVGLRLARSWLLPVWSSGFPRGKRLFIQRFSARAGWATSARLLRRAQRTSIRVSLLTIPRSPSAPADTGTSKSLSALSHQGKSRARSHSTAKTSCDRPLES